METQLEEGRARAKAKIPELEASLESLDMLERKKVRDTVVLPRGDCVRLYTGGGLALSLFHGRVPYLPSPLLHALPVLPLHCRLPERRQRPFTT